MHSILFLSTFQHSMQYSLFLAGNNSRWCPLHKNSSIQNFFNLSLLLYAVVTFSWSFYNFLKLQRYVTWAFCNFFFYFQANLTFVSPVPDPSVGGLLRVGGRFCGSHVLHRLVHVVREHHALKERLQVRFQAKSKNVLNLFVSKC